MLQQLPLPNVNLANHILAQRGEDIQYWDNHCSQVTDLVLDVYDGQRVHVEGDALDQYSWWYHSVPMVNGKIHDAWLSGWHLVHEPQTLADWLVKMFGTEDEIIVTIDGNDVYTGLPQNFIPRRVGLDFGMRFARIVKARAHLV